MLNKRLKEFDEFLEKYLKSEYEDSVEILQTGFVEEDLKVIEFNVYLISTISKRRYFLTFSPDFTII